MWVFLLSQDQEWQDLFVSPDMECLKRGPDLPFPINQDQECLDLKDTQSLLHFLGLCQCFLVQVLLASQRLLVSSQCHRPLSSSHHHLLLQHNRNSRRVLFNLPTSCKRTPLQVICSDCLKVQKLQYQMKPSCQTKVMMEHKTLKSKWASLLVSQVRSLNLSQLWQALN